MANDPKPLSRDQLAKFLPDHESIRRFERLFAVAGDLTPTDIAILYRLTQEASVDANTAVSMATQANDSLERIARSLELVSKAPAAKENNSLSADYVDFRTAAPVAVGAVGRLKWNDTDGTLDLGLKGGNATLQIGQENVLRVKNDDLTTLVDGEVVYITGASGANLLVKRALANSDVTSASTIGVVTEQIAPNGQGFITTFGQVRGFDTSAFNEGDVLYLSPTVAGAITATKPIAPQHLVLVGYCAKKSAGNGEIFVKVDNGYELEELHNVLITNPVADESLLRYDFAAAVWKNVTYSSIRVGTSSNLAGGAAGSLPYQSGVGSTAFLAATAAGNVLLSGATPSWGKVPLTTHVSGTLPVANGGTGVTTSTGSGSVVLSASPTFTGTVYNSSGTGYALGDGSTWTPAGFNAIPNYGMGYLTTGSHTALSSFGDMYFYVAQTLKLTINQSGQMIAPDVYNTTVGATNRDLFIDSTGKIGYVPSVRESKTNIQVLDDVSWILNLAPKSFNRLKSHTDGTYLSDHYDEVEYGLLADEAAKVNPELCFQDSSGKLAGVHYSKLIIPMLRMIQSHEETIKLLKSKLTNQE